MGTHNNAIGDIVVIKGKRYQKASFPGIDEPCKGCAFSAGLTHAHKCHIKHLGRLDLSIADGGRGCGGLLDSEVGIWVLTETPAPKKAPKKAPKRTEASKAVWSTKFLSIHPKSTKARLVELLQETVDQMNVLGTENAKLKNTLATLRKKVSK